MPAEIIRNIETKVVKSWTHIGQPTKVGEAITLSKVEYDYCVERGLVEPVQPLLTGGTR